MKPRLNRTIQILTLAFLSVSCSLPVDVGDLVHPDGGDADGDGGAPDGDGRVDADADTGGGDVDADGVGADADGDDGEIHDGTDADAGGDDDADGDAEADACSSSCAGGWLDSSTGLCWQDPPDGTPRNWDDAMAYCDGLSLCVYGPGSWHLPTISELRSLIRGCAGTETAGACAVTDECLDYTCQNASCDACPALSGPGTGGAYWPSGVGGAAGGWYWSSSSYDTNPAWAWYASFGDGRVNRNPKYEAHNARCVRPGP